MWSDCLQKFIIILSGVSRGGPWNSSALPDNVRLRYSNRAVTVSILQMKKD